jgi:oxygen-independent coproporphyrinogen-3 oxidase
MATETPLSPLGWLRQVETTGSGEGGREVVAAEDVEAEAVMMGLRLAEGLPVEVIPAGKSSVVNELAADGLLRIDGDRVYATPAGRLVLNRITGALLA